MKILRLLLTIPFLAAPAFADAEQPRWNAPLPEREAPNRQEILDRIRTEAERVRHGSDCGAHAHNHAFLEAFLYRVGCRDGACDEDRAQDAMQHLRRARAFQQCDASGDLPAPCLRRCRKRGDRAPFHWLEQPTQAWTWIREASSTSEEDRRVARELLLEGARRSHPPVDFGTSNRSLVAAVGLLRTARLFSDADGSDDWRAYAQRVWAHFRDVTDMEENAASYLANVWWPGLLQLASLMDTGGELWRDDRFVGLVERTFATTAPAGAMPAFGDSSSWGIAAPGLLWLFEEAAARLDEGRYAWLAQRILRFQAARMVDPDGRRDPWDRKMHHLAFAWLAAEQGPPPAAPEPLRYEVTRAAPPSGASVRTAAPGRLGLRFRHDAAELVALTLFAPHDDSGGTESARWRIWRWRNERSPTVRKDPLAEGPLVRLASSGAGPDPLVATPRIGTEPGAWYYFETESEDALAVIASSGPTDGGVWIDGEEEPEARLAFEIRSARGQGSVVTRRREVRVRPRSQWGRPPQAYAFGDEIVPDKLVLRSGFDPRDLFALVDLVAGYRHGHEALASFAGVLDAGSVLISETAYPYFEAKPGPEDENAALVRVGGRFVAGRGPREARVETFIDTPNLTRVRIGHDLPAGRSQERHILFVKNRLLWVRDRLELPPGGDGVVRWHVGWGRRVGDSAFEVATPGLLDNVWPVRNPTRLARIHFVPRSKLRAHLETDPDLAPATGCERPHTARGRIRARCRTGPATVVTQQGASPDGTLWLDSILVPHAPGEPPEVGVHAREGASVAIEVTLGPERWLLVDAPESTRLEGRDTQLEARLGVHAIRPGSPDYLYLEAARRFARGELDLRFDEPATLESGSFPPSRAEGSSP